MDGKLRMGADVWDDERLLWLGSTPTPYLLHWVQAFDDILHTSKVCSLCFN